MKAAQCHWMAVLLLAAAAAGCSTPGGQLAACQQEKEKLLATIREQRDTTRDLKEQVASLEGRLHQAETELARGPGSTRISSRPEAPKSAPVAQPESLPWRSPAKGAPSPQERGEARPSERPRVQLAALAERDSRVQFDPRAGTARLSVPLDLDRQSGLLTGEDKRHLDEIAKLLRSDEAKNARIVVVGPPDTQGDGKSAGGAAQAVVDYLDRHGIADSRLSIGSPQTLRAASHQSGGGPPQGVEIFLLEPGATDALASAPRGQRR